MTACTILVAKALSMQHTMLAVERP